MLKGADSESGGVYLFGTFAANTARADSDVDLAVVSSTGLFAWSASKVWGSRPETVKLLIC